MLQRPTAPPAGGLAGVSARLVRDDEDIDDPVQFRGLPWSARWRRYSVDQRRVVLGHFVHLTDGRSPLIALIARDWHRRYPPAGRHFLDAIQHGQQLAGGLGDEPPALGNLGT